MREERKREKAMRTEKDFYKNGEKIIYEEIGEGEDSHKVGDYVDVELRGGGRWLRGTIVKITHIPKRGIYQLHLNNGWCVHPDNWFSQGDKIIEHIPHKEQTRKTQGRAT